MAENLQEHPSIGECPQCGQQFFGLWVIGETLLEIHCPSCIQQDPGANGKQVSMRIEPISSKKGGEW